MSYSEAETRLQHSYDFDAFSDADRRSELKRLHEQASFFRDVELKYLQSCGLVPGAKVLEIGCGPGFVTGMLAECVSPGEAHGLDSSGELLNVALNVVSKKYTNTRFFKGDAYASGLPEKQYDFIYNRLIYQHLKDPRCALREAKRLVRPGGKICVVDVDAGWQFIEPHCPEFDRLNELSCEAQAKIGGDRYIGRKLPNYMRDVGLTSIKLDVIAITSLNARHDLLLGITTKFKALQVATPEADLLLQKIETFCSRQDHPPLITVCAFGVIGEV